MGAFVRGFPEALALASSQLRLPSMSSERVLLYVCPECGDIGCGAYSVKVSRTTDIFTWSDFAYENGYEDARSIEHLGPYIFNAEKYEAAIVSASAL